MNFKLQKPSRREISILVGSAVLGIVIFESVKVFSSEFAIFFLFALSMTTLVLVSGVDSWIISKIRRKKE